jgi:hypothetical protein
MLRHSCFSPRPATVIPSVAARLFLAHGFCAPGRGGRNLFAFACTKKRGVIFITPRNFFSSVFS